MRRDFLDSELRRQEKEHREGRLYGLYQVFRDQVFHELGLGEFANAFAQMLAYGLFLAKLNSNGEVITLANARQFVPGSFSLIRELVRFLDDLAAPEYTKIRWVVEELLSIVNGLKLRENPRRPVIQASQGDQPQSERTKRSTASSSAIPSSIFTRIFLANTTPR